MILQFLHPSLIHLHAPRPACLRGGRLGALSGAALVLMLLLSSLPNLAQKPSQARGKPDAKKGNALFMKNCSPCHGAKAQGGEGPSLHGLKLSSGQITSTIKNGVKGQMPAFGGKLKETDMKLLVAFVQSLKK